MCVGGEVSRGGGEQRCVCVCQCEWGGKKSVWVGKEVCG